MMDILPLIDWELLKRQEPTWVLGYSDTSTFLFAYTLLTGHASAHGTNYVDLRGENIDQTTARWEEVLQTPEKREVRQTSSPFYQSAWDFSKDEFTLDTPTEWKILDRSNSSVQFTGRLIGGCLDTITRLANTPYAPVEKYIHKYCQESGVVWYLESAELSAADMYRSLWQLKESGWFKKCNGVLFGRPGHYKATKDFEKGDALHAIFDELNIPVVYDTDIGHVPPQLTLVNGALATVTCQNGKGEVIQTFR